MAKFKGPGSTTRPADTSGVQRAFESSQQAGRDATNQANQAGKQVQGAVENVQAQDTKAQEMQLRKDRLTAEMAKGGLEFTKTADGTKVASQTEGAKAAQAHTVKMETSKAATEAQRAAAYELSQRMALEKSIHEDDDPGRKAALQALAKDYKGKQKTFEALLNGDQDAMARVQSELPNPAGGPDAMSTDGEPVDVKGGADPQRLVASARAAVDHSQLKFVASTQGHLPDDVMDDSPAWQAFHGWKQNVAAIMKSGTMMIPPFKSIDERNRFLNEAAAKLTLTGRPPMSDQMTSGMVPAQSPAGQQDNAGPQASAPGPVPNPDPAAGPLPGPGGWNAQN